MRCNAMQCDTTQHNTIRYVIVNLSITLRKHLTKSSSGNIIRLGRQRHRCHHLPHVCPFGWCVVCPFWHCFGGQYYDNVQQIFTRSVLLYSNNVAAFVIWWRRWRWRRMATLRLDTNSYSGTYIHTKSGAKLFVLPLQHLSVCWVNCSLSV